MELQEFKNAVLRGIDWCRHKNADGVSPVLHIGRVGNYQIYLSEDRSREVKLADGTSERTYVMQLWEMHVRTVHIDDAAGMTPGSLIKTALPSYDLVIPSRIIKAADTDGAKLAAVDAINTWNENRLVDAKNAFYDVDGLFGNLQSVLSDKITRERAADALETIGIPTQAVTVLHENGIYVLGDLAKTSVEDMKAMRGLGTKSVNEIVFRLKSMGIQPKHEPGTDKT